MALPALMYELRELFFNFFIWSKRGDRVAHLKITQFSCCKPVDFFFHFFFCFLLAELNNTCNNRQRDKVTGARWY